ncbi:MAG: methyltransferase domain-containing protein [Magnetococcales bacterium]|nr:methyltransferase domain-containing protein [Magnetococcales bacterium]
MKRRREVAAAFGAVADEYEEHAQVQRHAARRLADTLPALHLPEQPRVLELGCGSGLLSRHLLRQRPRGHFLLTDASWAMVRTVRQRVTGKNCRYAVMDGEHPAVATGLDLIVSGLTWQWFGDPLGSFVKLVEWLRPGGWLALSTLGASTFQEWRDACEVAGAPCGILSYPGRADWEERFPPTGQGSLAEEVHVVPHLSALAFLQGLRAVGADRPAPGHRPLTAGELRRVLRRHQRAFNVTYRIYYVLYQKGIG